MRNDEDSIRMYFSMSDIVQLWYPKQRVTVLESSSKGGWFEIWVSLRLKKKTRKNPDPD